MFFLNSDRTTLPKMALNKDIKQKQTIGKRVTVKLWERFKFEIH